MAMDDAAKVVECISPLPFEAAQERARQVIAQAGLQLFATIDHAAGAREAGFSMRPTVVLIYGHPKGGTPLMLAAPAAALDLPLRVMLREDDQGRTIVTYHPVAAMLQALSASAQLGSNLERAQGLVVTALTAAGN